MVLYYTQPIKIEPFQHFDICVDYTNRTIVLYTKLYYFYANTYDEYYYFAIGSCVYHADTLQCSEQSIIPSETVQISEHYIKHK